MEKRSKVPACTSLDSEADLLQSTGNDCDRDGGCTVDSLGESTSNEATLVLQQNPQNEALYEFDPSQFIIDGSNPAVPAPSATPTLGSARKQGDNSRSKRKVPDAPPNSPSEGSVVDDPQRKRPRIELEYGYSHTIVPTVEHHPNEMMNLFEFDGLDTSLYMELDALSLPLSPVSAEAEGNSPARNPQNAAEVELKASPGGREDQVPSESNGRKRKRARKDAPKIKRRFTGQELQEAQRNWISLVHTVPNETTINMKWWWLMQAQKIGMVPATSPVATPTDEPRIFPGRSRVGPLIEWLQKHGRM